MRITFLAKGSHSSPSPLSINWKIQLERKSAGISKTRRRPTIIRKERINGIERASGEIVDWRHDFAFSKASIRACDARTKLSPPIAVRTSRCDSLRNKVLQTKRKHPFWNGVRSAKSSSKMPRREARGLRA